VFSHDRPRKGRSLPGVPHGKQSSKHDRQQVFGTPGIISLPAPKPPHLHLENATRDGLAKFTAISWHKSMKAPLGSAARRLALSRLHVELR
jgi:hypothetical protein